MAYERIDFGKKFLVYDNIKQVLVGCGTNCNYLTENQKRTRQIIGLKDSFKERGSLLVKPELKNHWEKNVDKYFSQKEDIIYNAACLEAAIKCMEILSKGDRIENAYMPIDIYNQETCHYFGIELSAWQNFDVAYVVSYYHDRGKDFLEYRNTHFRQKVKRLI